MSLLQTSSPLMWGDKRFHTWNYEMRETMDTKVFKVMLDAGFTCPNRDGSIAKGAAPSAAPEAPVISPAAAATILSPSSTRCVTASI